MDTGFIMGCNTSSFSDIPIDLIRLLESIIYSQLIIVMLQLVLRGRYIAFS
jgi:hypothetical protein